MRLFLDFNNWKWWHFSLFFTITYPLGNVLSSYLFDCEVLVENVVIMGVVGAVIGLIIGSLVEFVRRDKAKTEKNNKLTK